MAEVPNNQGVASVSPTTQAPDDTQRINASPDAFGAAINTGLQQAGQGATTAGKFYGEVAADDAANKYQEESTKILYGDPSKPGIDGQPDTGFFGLKGADAMRARAGVAQQLDQLEKNLRGNLSTSESELQFDSFSRRYRSMVDGRVGEFADSQSNAWYGEVNTASAKLAQGQIAANVDDPDMVLHGTADLIRAYIKQAQLRGAKPGDPVFNEAVAQGKQESATIQIQAVAQQNPERAAVMLEKYKPILGTEYDNLYAALQPKLNHNQAVSIADGILAGYGIGPKAGTTTSPTGITTQQLPAPADVSAVGNAIHGQESGGAADSVTSVDNAHGGWQITPGTFAQYAKPGEDINKPADNEAVGRRIVADLYQKTGGDPLRTAVGYFSGEGNIAPAGSATPWKEDKKDGNGKSVSSYVSDIQKRLGGDDQSAPADLPNKGEIYQKVIDATEDMPPAVQAEALSRVSRQLSIQDTVNAAAKTQVLSDTANAIQATEAGVEGVTIDEQQIRHLVPAVQANKLIDEYHIATRLGDTMRAAQWATPGELAGMQADVSGGTGTFSNMLKVHAKSATTGPGAPPPPAGPLPSASIVSDMGLTPQEQFLYQQHVHNLQTAPVDNADGSTSTLLQVTVEHDGKVYNIPTVWDGKAHTGPEVAQHAAQIGWDKWPAYPTEAAAQSRYDQMHGYMEKDITARQQAQEQGQGQSNVDQDAFFRLRTAAAGRLDKLVEARNAALIGPSADPAAYVASNPAVQEAAQEAKDSPNSPAATQAWVNASLAVQTHLGVPPEQQHFLDRGSAIGMVQKLMNSGDPHADMVALQQQYGQAWPQMYRDMVTLGKMPAVMQAVPTLDNPADAQMLTRWAREVPNGKTADDLIGSKKASDIRTAIQNDAVSVQPFLRSLLWSGASATYVDQVQQSIYDLAYAKSFYPPSSQDAATASREAVEAFTSKYEFMPGGARVPVDKFGAITTQAGVTLQGLTEANVTVPKIYGQLGMPSKDEYFDMLRANPQWITSPKADSIQLMDNYGRIVRDNSGNPISIPFDLKTPDATQGYNFTRKLKPGEVAINRP